MKTTGEHESPFGGMEEFTAMWTRAAGQSTGKVVMNLPSLGTFTHDYAILQFEGTLTYALTNKTITATILLTNIAASDDQISGPLSLTITNNTKLGYGSGTWSGSGSVSYVFHSIDSLDRIGTNYIAAVGFDDGYPATTDEDYQFWFLLIHSADANNNDVLDLVETSTSTERPRLQIRKIQAGVEITVFGAAGTSYTLETAGSVANSAWTNLQTVAASSSPQTVSIGSTNAMKFFRLRQ